jgi:hypothetical protein
MAKQAIGPNQEKWLRALESGEYLQCTGKLGIVVDGVEQNCCLGVACRVMGADRRVLDDGRVSYDGSCGCAPPKVAYTQMALHAQAGDFKGERLKNRGCLAEANDHAGATFAEIAAFCRAHPEAVFTEPR